MKLGLLFNIIIFKKILTITIKNLLNFSIGSKFKPKFYLNFKKYMMFFHCSRKVIMLILSYLSIVFCYKYF